MSFMNYEANDIKKELESEEKAFILNEYKMGLRHINSKIFNIKERIAELKKDLEQGEKELEKHKKELVNGDFAKKVLPIYHNQNKGQIDESTGARRHPFDLR